MSEESELTPELKRALSFWQLGIQYLHLAQSVAKAISDSGNAHALVFERSDWEEIDKKFREATNWTDYNLGIPVIFNFYHGIELILKGLLVALDQPSDGHKITELLRMVKASYGEPDFIQPVEKYLALDSMPPIIRRFVDESDADVDEWYQAYKYPENLKGDKKYLHHNLMQQGEDGAVLFAEIMEDIQQLRMSLVAYVRGQYPAVA